MKKRSIIYAIALYIVLNAGICRAGIIYKQLSPEFITNPILNRNTRTMAIIKFKAQAIMTEIFNNMSINVPFDSDALKERLIENTTIKRMVDDNDGVYPFVCEMKTIPGGLILPFRLRTRSDEKYYVIIFVHRGRRSGRSEFDIITVLDKKRFKTVVSGNEKAGVRDFLTVPGMDGSCVPANIRKKVLRRSVISNGKTPATAERKTGMENHAYPLANVRSIISGGEMDKEIMAHWNKAKDKPLSDKNRVHLKRIVQLADIARIGGEELSDKSARAVHISKFWLFEGHTGMTEHLASKMRDIAENPSSREILAPSEIIYYVIGKIMDEKYMNYFLKSKVPMDFFEHCLANFFGRAEAAEILSEVEYAMKAKDVRGLISTVFENARAFVYKFQKTERNERVIELLGNMIKFLDNEITVCAGKGLDTGQLQSMVYWCRVKEKALRNPGRYNYMIINEKKENDITDMEIVYMLMESCVSDARGYPASDDVVKYFMLAKERRIRIPYDTREQSIKVLLKRGYFGDVSCIIEENLRQLALELRNHVLVRVYNLGRKIYFVSKALDGATVKNANENKMSFMEYIRRHLVSLNLPDDIYQPVVEVDPGIIFGNIKKIVRDGNERIKSSLQAGNVGEGISIMSGLMDYLENISTYQKGLSGEHHEWLRSCIKGLASDILDIRAKMEKDESIASEKRPVSAFGDFIAGTFSGWAVKVGIMVTPPEEKFTIYTNGDFFIDDDFDKDGLLYASRFNLRMIPKDDAVAIIDKVIFEVSSASLEAKDVILQLSTTSVMKCPRDTLVKKLKELTSMGARFIVVDPAGITSEKDRYRRSTYRRDIYAIILLARKINKKNRNDPEFYSVLKYLMKCRIGYSGRSEEANDNDVFEKFIGSIISYNVKDLLNMTLASRPVKQFDMNELREVSKTLIFA